MVMRDREYKTVENIVLICYTVGLVLTCVTIFIPFIFLAVAAYPISLAILNNNKCGNRTKTVPRKQKSSIRRREHYGKFGKRTES